MKILHVGRERPSRQASGDLFHLAFSLVLGAVAGWLGGRSGVVHPVYADRVVPTRVTTL